MRSGSTNIDPAPFRGVLTLPISALKSASPVLGNPVNRHRAVPLSYDQFRFGFANAVRGGGQGALRHVRSAGVPASRSSRPRRPTSTPWTEVKVDSENPDRGPLLIISGQHDNTVPPAIAKASYKKQQRNEGVTELAEIPGRGYALTIDGGWREVADTALAFGNRFAGTERT